jgi:hypothetical protein
MDFSVLYKQTTYNFSLWLGAVLRFLPKNIKINEAQNIYKNFILEEENFRNEEQKAIRKSSR